MKNFKIVFAALVMGLAANAFGNYLFSWKVYNNVPTWYNWDYAQIAVYNNDAFAQYLYEAEAPANTHSVSWKSDLWNSTSAPATSIIEDAWVNSPESYTYVIELWSDAGFVASSITYTYDMLLDGYLQGTGTGSADPGTKNITYVIPEPTSALLLMVGLGLLGLKRKARKVLLPCLLLASMVSFGEADLKFVTLKSEGPDKYADGTVVKDGERYAVVYTADPALVTFAADGQVTGGTLILTSRIAKNGGCPETSFQLGSGVTAGCTGGEYTLFLLDTRLADGTIAAAVNGKVPLVNGYGPVTGGVVTVSESLVPEGTPEPTFTGIEVGDEWVTLTLENTVPYLQYTVDGAEEAANGKEDEPITLKVRKEEGGQMFRARRK